MSRKYLVNISLPNGKYWAVELVDGVEKIVGTATGSETMTYLMGETINNVYTPPEDDYDRFLIEQGKNAEFIGKEESEAFIEKILESRNPDKSMGDASIGNDEDCDPVVQSPTRTMREEFRCCNCGEESINQYRPCNCFTGVGFRIINGKMEHCVFKEKEPKADNEFEEWALLGSEPYDIRKLPNSNYKSGDTQNAWYGYQAATSHERKRTEKLVEAANKAMDSLWPCEGSHTETCNKCEAYSLLRQALREYGEGL